MAAAAGAGAGVGAGVPLTLAERIIALCDELDVSNIDRLSHVHDAQAVLRARLNISDAKAEGGTTGEFWTARHFGLKWEGTKKTGADATDAQGRECEIKSSLHPAKTYVRTQRTNICYTTPHRRTDETDDAFVVRTQEHIRKNTGGHLWSTWFAKTPAGAADRIVLSWWIPSAPLAQLIGKKMRASSDMRKESRVISINFGAAVCRTCGGVHRIDTIVRALGGWVSRVDARGELAVTQRAFHPEIDTQVIDELDSGACASQCN